MLSIIREDDALCCYEEIGIINGGRDMMNQESGDARISIDVEVKGIVFEEKSLKA